MAKYLARSCPKCDGYLGIVLREPGRNVPVRAVNGHCLKCDYRLDQLRLICDRLFLRLLALTLEERNIAHSCVLI